MLVYQENMSVIYNRKTRKTWVCRDIVCRDIHNFLIFDPKHIYIVGTRYNRLAEAAPRRF